MGEFTKTATRPQHHARGGARRDRRSIRVVASAVILTLVAAACGSSGSGSSGPATTAPVVPQQAAYEAPGPYVPGVTQLNMNGRRVEVWYPADRGAEAGKAKDVFSISGLLPDNLKSIVPADIDPHYTTDAYRDIKASTKGPFPIVLFSHGYAGYPTLYAFLTTHLASWGFIVVAPDHNERGLLAALTQCVKPADDAAVLLAARDLVVAQSNDPTALLHNTADPTKVATVGHSAGAAAAMTAANDPSVATFVALDGAGVRSSSATPPETTADGCIVRPTTTTTAAGATTSTAPPTTIAAGDIPQKPGMIITGGNDAVIPLDRLRPVYDQMADPKRLVVIDGAGHNSVTDICLIGADQGGLIKIAAKVGIQVPEQLAVLFEDGCDTTKGYPAPKQVWEVPRHFVVAQLRWVFGIDPEPVGLGPGIADAFPPLRLDYEFTN